MGPILRVLCHDYSQSQSMRLQSMKDQDIGSGRETQIFPALAEMQTKIWQKRIQNSRIDKTMWTLWGGPEEADLAKYSLQLLAFGRHGSKEQLDIEQYV